MDEIKRVAEAAGYQLAYGEESRGDRVFGLCIFVKLSDRKIGEKDGECVYPFAEQIRDAVLTVSAEVDPNGPAERERYRSEIAAIYAAAGVSSIYMEPIPNGYCSRPCCLNRPWFRVTSAIGHVVVGWRKRVLSIDWKDTVVKETGEQLFPGEAVTRWETGIHAWSAEKAAEYIRRLHTELKVAQ